MLSEVLGVHAVTSGLGGLSTYGLYASAGQPAPAEAKESRMKAQRTAPRLEAWLGLGRP